MTIFESVALAVLQGLTEFLPVSSSGHLALASAFFKIPGNTLAFDVMLHLGTLTAVLMVFGGDLLSLAAGVLRGDRGKTRQILVLAMASVPAGAAGICLSGWVEGVSGNPLAVSLLMLVTGTALFATRFAPRGEGKPGFRSGAVIGISQALAILPGVSRSGLTISAGLLCGTDRAEAGRFSFLLSVPAILGAAVMELPDAEWNTSFAALAAGFAVSALTGYAALRVLLRFVRSGVLHRFCWYCWAVGAGGTALVLANGGL
jgi:undecaprenyl-diphosphatase